MNFLKKVLKKEKLAVTNSNISSYLAKEIDEIVSKTVDNLGYPLDNYGYDSQSSFNNGGMQHNYHPEYGGHTAGPLNDKRKRHQKSPNLPERQYGATEEGRNATRRYGTADKQDAFSPNHLNYINEEDYQSNETGVQQRSLAKRRKLPSATSQRTNSRSKVSYDYDDYEDDYYEEDDHSYELDPTYSSRGSRYSNSYPQKAVNYLDEEVDEPTLLPFEEQEISPKIKDLGQLTGVLKKNLRPALDRWLDDNLEIIIAQSLQKRRRR